MRNESLNPAAYQLCKAIEYDIVRIFRDFEIPSEAMADEAIRESIAKNVTSHLKWLNSRLDYLEGVAMNAMKFAPISQGLAPERIDD